MPGARIVGRRERRGRNASWSRPVDAAGRDEVRAAVVEALLQQLAVLGPRRRLAHELLARRVVALQQHDLEVVPGGPVAVDADALEAGRAADRLGDGGEHGVGLAAAGPERTADRQDALEGIMRDRRRPSPAHRPRARGAESEREPDVPELREEAPVDVRAQVRDARRAARAGPRADLARGHQRVVVAPARDALVVVDEQLGDLVPGRAQRVAGVVAVERGERLQPRVAVLRQRRDRRQNAS